MAEGRVLQAGQNGDAPGRRIRGRHIGLPAALWLFVAALSGIVPAFAAGPLPAPSGPVILTVSGDIDPTQSAGSVDFDRELLQSFEWRSVSTFTPWSDGLHRFEGISLAALLDRVGARGEKLVAVALNDYKVDIPRDDAARFDVLLALKHDGEWMSVRDKGPIWVIYPNGTGPKDIPDMHATRMVWQLRTLKVE